MKDLLIIQNLGMPQILLIVIVLVALYFMNTYNALIKLRNRVKEAFSAMDVHMKKRYDLVPNLVNTVKGYASHEKETLEAVIQARNLGQSASTPQEMMEAEGQLNSALSRLMVVVEQYPDLKANTNFMQLQTELSSLEGEIAKARKYYNASVRKYHNRRDVFPSVIVANMFGFESFDMFEISEAERVAPTVSFD